jgi:ABC-type transport system involved in cytochrome c biogenesis ATPase subunit
MFSKSSMQEGTKFDFLRLKLTDDFAIPNDGESKVIFGFNGIGKTSIFSYIKEYGDTDNITFLDYVNDRDNFIRHKKKLIVSPDHTQITALINENEVSLKSMELKNEIKNNFNVTKQGQASILGSKVLNAFKDLKPVFTINEQQMVELDSLLTDLPKAYLIENFDNLNEIRTYEDEIADYKKNIIHNSLVMMSEAVNDSDDCCPVCDTEYPNILEKINSKIDELKNRKSVLIEGLKKKNIQVNEDNISKYVQAAGMLVDHELRQDWIICSGSLERFQFLRETIDSINEKEEVIDELQDEARELYRRLKANNTAIKNDISRYFRVGEQNITFDDNIETLEIKLDRDISTYSTGEINLFSFLIRIYEFIGSEKNILILDDPVSSLDLINHYKIVYEIVKTKAREKTVVILTHSVEMMNSINSQYPASFDFYYMEETQANILIQQIPIHQRESNILTLRNLIDHDRSNVINLLIRKENAPFEDEIHKLFHYDDFFEYTSDIGVISNDYFCTLIDDFQEIDNHTFEINSLNKIIHIVAVRVWVEKQIKEILAQDNNLLNAFRTKTNLGSKIAYLFSDEVSNTISLPENLSREKLMSKKVMLNQGVHYQSQVMPFAYAINLSINDLNIEVIDIREMFV